MRLPALITGLLAALPAAAQEMGRIDTASGPAVLKREETSIVLTVGGQRFVADGMMYAYFDQQVGDVILVGFSGGGTACPGLFAWLDPRPGSVRLTEIFGTCSDLPRVSWTSEAVIVTLPSLAPGEGLVDFLWDGKSLAVAERQQGYVASGLPPGGPADLWAGRWPQELLKAAEWQDLLGALLGQDALLDAQRLTSGPGEPFAVAGDWLIARGCQAHNCGDTRSILALRRTDGALVVALWESGGAVRVWGDLSAGTPPAVAQLIAEH